MAVDESNERWERFRDEILMPQMQADIQGGFPTRPKEIAIDVNKVMPEGSRIETIAAVRRS